jgi:hypothetical protein
MLRFKQFTGNGPELEQAVNAWLEEFEPDVTQMVQTQDADTVTICFLFQESFRGQERRIASQHGMPESTPPSINPEDLPDYPITVPPDPGHITTDVP